MNEYKERRVCGTVNDLHRSTRFDFDAKLDSIRFHSILVTFSGLKLHRHVCFFFPIALLNHTSSQS